MSEPTVITFSIRRRHIILTAIAVLVSAGLVGAGVAVAVTPLAPKVNVQTYLHSADLSPAGAPAFEQGTYTPAFSSVTVDGHLCIVVEGTLGGGSGAYPNYPNFGITCKW